MRPPFWLLALVLASPMFAGCLTDDDASSKSLDRDVRVVSRLATGASTYVATLPDGSLADPSLLLGLPPLKGEQRFIGARTFEPTLGIDSKGAIYMVAFGGGAKIRVSRDQGATWNDTTARLPTGQNNPPNSNDPFVYVDAATDRVFTSDLQALICSWMNYSDDGGRTWTTNPIGCGHPFGVHDHQSIAVGKSRTGASQWKDRVVYYCVNRVGDSSCAASMNGGFTFGPLVPVMLGVDVEAAGFCGGLTGHVKADHAGRAYLGKNQCGRPAVGVTEDDGRTWRVTTVATGVGIRDHDVEIAADAGDHIYAFWIADNGLPHLALSQDHGRTWGKPINVAPPGLTATEFPAIAAGADRKIAFAYIGTDHPKGYATTNWTGAVWHAYLGVITNALEPTPIVLTTIADSPEDPVAYNQCGGTRCNGMGDFIDIQIDPQGRPWAALVDVCNTDCLKTHRNDANQGFVGTLTSGPSLVEAPGPLPALPAVPPGTPFGEE